MNVINEIKRINEKELEDGIPFAASWHQKYRHSAWIYLGGLPYDLTEGDVICVMSQVGEVEDINLVRDAETGKSKGFCFLKYEDQRSTVLAVDNFNGATILERTIRVDHCEKYRLPKHLQDDDEDDEKSSSSSDDDDEDDDAASQEPKQRGLPGHAYEKAELANNFSIHSGKDIFAAPEESKKEKKKRKKREKKEKKERKKEKKLKKKHRDSEELSETASKRQRRDIGFEPSQRKDFPSTAKDTERREVKSDAASSQRKGDKGAHPGLSSGGGGPSWRGRLEPKREK